MVGVCENGIPPKAGKPAQGGQAHQRRASPPEAGKPTRGGQAHQRRASSGVVHSGEKS